MRFVIKIKKMVARSPLRIADCQMSKFYEPRIQVWNYVVYTDIAGFTMMMTSATIRVHYACINKCARLAQKCVRINS